MERDHKEQWDKGELLWHANRGYLCIYLQTVSSFYDDESGWQYDDVEVLHPSGTIYVDSDFYFFTMEELIELESELNNSLDHEEIVSHPQAG